MESRTIFFDNKNWEYFVDYKQQKNMYLKIKDKKIIVSAPFFVRYEVIEEFVSANLAKVLAKLANQELHERLVISKIAFFPEPFIYFLDKKLALIVKYQKQQTKIFLSDDIFFIYTPFALDSEVHQPFFLKKINLFLKKLAWPIFQQRLEYWQNIMNLQAKVLEVRLMKNKWGVCFLKQKKITLNSRLIHFSYDVIDYVVIHELAHLVHPNHSKKFWLLVANYCPNFKTYKNILKYSNVQVKVKCD